MDLLCHAHVQLKSSRVLALLLVALVLVPVVWALEERRVSPSIHSNTHALQPPERRKEIEAAGGALGHLAHPVLDTAYYVCRWGRVSE